MKILIVNDDSISAPGIAVLARTAAEFGEVTVVAPAEQCSAMSQKLTLRETLTLEPEASFPAPVKEAWKLGGTPVDCVKVALEHIMQEKPDWVFSGINNGYNAGFDVAYSGTLGATFEAARSGVPAIAFSVAAEKHLEAVQAYLPGVIRELLAEKPGTGIVWNVNFPSMKPGNPKGILRERVPAAVSMYREHYERSVLSDGRVVLSCVGTPTEDAAIPAGSDAEAVRRGYISIGKVRAF
ncbi:MAG: 5'/3'-nucleotidase SurE [Oscillospiraceae bacterium]|nr:5'/3'-nucleotidase SurE [Oscillospiraceae bacterium]